MLNAITIHLAGITEFFGVDWDPELPKLTWEQWLFWFVVLTTISVSLSLTAVWWVMRDLPNDYFIRDFRPSRRRGFFGWIASNTLGLCVFLLGVLFFITPGQGALLILSGLIMIDIPGKHKWERRIASNAKVFRGLNWLRHKVKREPFLPTQASSNVARDPASASTTTSASPEATVDDGAT